MYIWPILGVFATGTTEEVCLHEVAACVIGLPACFCWLDSFHGIDTWGWVQVDCSVSHGNAITCKSSIVSLQVTNVLGAWVTVFYSSFNNVAACIEGVWHVVVHFCPMLWLVKCTGDGDGYSLQINVVRRVGVRRRSRYWTFSSLQPASKVAILSSLQILPYTSMLTQFCTFT